MNQKHNLNQKIFPWDYANPEEIYIGYFTIDNYRKLKYKTKRILKHPNDPVAKQVRFFPVFVNKKDWNNYSCPMVKSKRLDLKGNKGKNICIKRHSLESK